jgi:hypothetical protein
MNSTQIGTRVFKGIQAGDRVTFLTPRGHKSEGRARALLLFPTHVVVNCGGRHGTPAVVNERNYVCHTRRRRRSIRHAIP